MLTPTAVSGPIPPKPTSTKNTPKPTTRPAESSPATNTQETTKTDNTFTVAQKTPGREPPQQFRNTLDEKVANEANETTQQAPDGQEPNGQGPVAAQPAVVQQWLAGYIKNAEHGKDGIDTEALPKVGNKLAQMLAEVRAPKPATPAGQPPNPTQNKPSTAVEKQPLGLNIASTKTSNTPATIDNLPASDKAPVATTNSATQQNNKQTSAETTTGTKQVN
ncbi:unnamed protein product [marine sediment metagenome]|uniref:Uncharacterized protein n=1 Tax=marine sediment metagenome TaxID=412755 RepID=X1HGP5_9ZZZZ